MTKRLLIAEDDEDLALVYSCGLKRLGYRVTWVKSGAELLHEVLENHYDLLITDLMMPGGSGTSALSMLVEHEIDMPIIVVTGLIDKIDLPARAVRLLKPVSVKTIQEMTREMLAETAPG